MNKKSIIEMILTCTLASLALTIVWGGLTTLSAQAQGPVAWQNLDLHGASPSDAVSL